MKFTAAAIITLAAGAPSFNKPSFGCDETDVCKALKTSVTKAELEACLESLPAKCTANARFKPEWAALNVHANCKASNCGFDLTAWRKVITDNIPKGCEVSYVGNATLTLKPESTYNAKKPFMAVLDFDEEDCETELDDQVEMEPIYQDDTKAKVTGATYYLQKILEGNNSRFLVTRQDGSSCVDSTLKAVDAEPVQITYTAPNTSGVAANLALGTAALTAVLFA